MHTRKQYLAGDCTHSEYYGQFVDEGIKQEVLRKIGKTRLEKSKDLHLNDIPLRLWDTFPLHARTNQLLKQAGTYGTLSDVVCIYKQAAKQIIKEL